MVDVHQTHRKKQTAWIAQLSCTPWTLQVGSGIAWRICFLRRPRSLKGWNWHPAEWSTSLKVTQLRLKKSIGKSGLWFFFSKKRGLGFIFLDSASVYHRICEICPIWVIFVGAIKHFSSQQGFDLRLIRHRWRFFFCHAHLYSMQLCYIMTIPKAPPPLEKDVRRRLDLVGNSCSHLSKREQITVMGFDAIGQNKDGFSMKKCHKNSKVVFFPYLCSTLLLHEFVISYRLVISSGPGFFCSCFTPRFRVAHVDIGPAGRCFDPATTFHARRLAAKMTWLGKHWNFRSFFATKTMSLTLSSQSLFCFKNRFQIWWFDSWLLADETYKSYTANG